MSRDTNKLPQWLTKLVYYEYWTWWLFYIPLLPYWLYLTIRSGSPIWFTYANPGIFMGGFFGESKKDILNSIPTEYLPKFCFITTHALPEQAYELMQRYQIEFPVICKPDIGERGYLVKRVDDMTHLEKYMDEINEDFIIQEYISYPEEVGVFYRKYPSGKAAGVISITLKEFMTVTGDGKCTIEQLIKQNTRYRFQLHRLRECLGQVYMQSIPIKNEKIVLERIGNHALGTKFLNGNHLINDKLDETFKEIADNVNGFYFGRFDLRVTSLEELYEGRGIKIIELNGVSSEPGHIYQPGYGVFRAYKDLFCFWYIAFKISMENKKSGQGKIPLKQFLKTVVNHFWGSKK